MNNKADYSALQIAKYFIWKAAKEGKTISNKKLQKLLYYAQSWSMVFENKPLFMEDIQAWVHGPAIDIVYQTYKKYGSEGITLSVEDSDIAEIKEKELLDSIWQVYGKFDAEYLETLTHNEDPWQKARESLGDSEPSQNIITLDSVKEYYSQKLNAA